MVDHGGALYIKTFGCQMNTYDSSRIVELLVQKSGYHLVEHPLNADLIVLNTCHIREKAEEKLFSELGRLRKLTARRAPRFAVGGCVGEAVGKQIFRRAPFVDLVFGPQNYHHLPGMLRRLAHGERYVHETEARAEMKTETKFDGLPSVTTHAVSASVTVQEGCDHFCTYCVVPHTRGRAWNRSVHEVLEEVRGLTHQGVREVVLLGQNINAYEACDEEGISYDLALLIRRVALLSGIERIRFATSHPADMTETLIESFGDVVSLCPYLHLPVQSGSDKILVEMKRGYSVAEYRRWVDRLRAVRPDVVISTDFIVGFPGETEADFQATLALVEQVGFDQAYSFKFSPRPDTPACDMSNSVPNHVASQRLEALQTLLNQQQLESNQRQGGRIESVLVEGHSKKGEGMLVGRTPGSRVVNFLGDPNWIGQTISVRILEGRPNSLLGQPL